MLGDKIKNMKRTICLVVVLLAFSFAAAADPLVLGVLEQPQCKKGQKLSARLLFVKGGNRWIVLFFLFSFFGVGPV
jgi:hypothetical protein